MYQVWDPSIQLPRISDLKKINSERVTIKPFVPEEDGYVFLHGVAIAKFKDRLFCAFAHNKGNENSDGEEVNYVVSNDGGKTWSGCILGNFRPQADIGVSHGSFLVKDEALYFFAPQFKGVLGAKMMRMGAYVFDETSEKFRHLGVALDDRFWPMSEPLLLSNGNYIMAGIYVGADFNSPDNTAAVAISRGSDISKWDIVKIPLAEGVKAWGECAVTANNGVCRLYCRDNARNRKVLYAESTDFGRNWSELNLTNMPMIDSKPYAGTLSNGRRYLICSSARDVLRRNPLTIAITEPFSDLFCKIFSIDQVLDLSSGGQISYPYAIEFDNKLYVAYSSTKEGNNRNSAELAIINIEDLQ